jgi:hypothetical protein
MRRTVEDQFAHRLAGRGRVEHAPDTMAGRHVGTVNTRHGADQRKAVLDDRSEARTSRPSPARTALSLGWKADSVFGPAPHRIPLGPAPPAWTFHGT